MNVKRSNRKKRNDIGKKRDEVVEEQRAKSQRKIEIKGSIREIRDDGGEGGEQHSIKDP